MDEEEIPLKSDGVLHIFEIKLLIDELRVRERAIKNILKNVKNMDKRTMETFHFIKSEMMKNNLQFCEMINKAHSRISSLIDHCDQMEDRIVKYIDSRTETNESLLKGNCELREMLEEKGKQS